MTRKSVTIDPNQPVNNSEPVSAIHRDVLSRFRQSLAIAFATMGIIPLLTCTYFLCLYVLPYTIPLENVLVVSFLNTFLAICGYWLMAATIRDQTSRLELSESYLRKELNQRILNENLLHRATVQWQTTFDAVNNSICLLDCELRIVFANKAAIAMFGAESQQLTGRKFRELAHVLAKQPTDLLAAMTATTHHRETAVHEINEHWFEITVDPVSDDSGNLTGFVHVVADIHDRKQAENRLLQQMSELERWREITLGREHRIAELKCKINAMAVRHGEAPPYETDRA